MTQREYLLIGCIVIIAAAEMIFNTSWLTLTLLFSAGVICLVSGVRFTNQLNKVISHSGHVKFSLNVLKERFQQHESGMLEAAEQISELGKDGERKFHRLDNDHPLAAAVQSVDQQIKSFRREEEIRTWQSVGLSRSNELLRSHDKDIETLSNELLAHLIRYIGANQGGIFIHKELEGAEYLEMVACYAYNKHRIREKRVELGSGLLGQCFYEKETLFLLDVPDKYVDITSGLGESTPSNLILVPLVVNELIHGVMEFASFQPLAPYQVEFLEKFAENFASVLASMKNALNTKKLLSESQTLATELQSREEEMRQQMEELASTQEEMSRKQAELNGLVNAINNTLGLVELNTEGSVIHSNEIFNEIMRDIDQLDYRALTGDQDESGDFLRRMLSVSIPAKDYETANSKGEQLWLNLSFSPITTSQGITQKILVLIHDVTQRKRQESELEKLSLAADNTDNSVIITDEKGRIEYVNPGFCELTGYSVSEVMGLKPGSFLQGPDTDPATILRIREALKSEMPINEEILNYTKSGESYWISMVINPVFDASGKLEKYISIQANITQTKISELDSSHKLQAISKSNAIIEFDMDGNILEANENLLQIFGYEKEEIIGKHHQIFVKESMKNSPEYVSFWETLAKGQFISDEFERVSKLGETVWLKGIYNPILDIRNKPYKIIKFATDITSEKHLKFETHKQDVELTSQLEAINKTIAAVEFDLLGNIKDANDIFCSITGRKCSELKGQNYLDIIPFEDKEKPQTLMLWQNLKEGKFFSGEFKFRDISNKELWLKGTFNPINDWQGNPYKVMMYAQFNTEEKEKQRSLNESYGALKKSIPTFELNPDGSFKNGNTLFLDQFGFKRLDLRNKTFEEFIGKEKDNPTVEKIFREINTTSFSEQELHLCDVRGDKITYKATFSAIRDLEENLIKILVILIEKNLVLKN